MHHFGFNLSEEHSLHQILASAVTMFGNGRRKLHPFKQVDSQNESNIQWFINFCINTVHICFQCVDYIKNYSNYSSINWNTSVQLTKKNALVTKMANSNKIMILQMIQIKSSNIDKSDAIIMIEITKFVTRVVKFIDIRR